MNRYQKIRERLLVSNYSLWDDYSMSESARRYRLRRKLVRRYSWAIPNDEALDAIAALGPVVEVGAGTGYWAKLLAERGVDVVAYDIHTPGSGKNTYGHHTSWFDVKQGNVEVVREHPDRTLFLCWPPFDDPMAAEAAYWYQGEHIAYIGEWTSGCTASQEFFYIAAGNVGWPDYSLDVDEDVQIQQRRDAYLQTWGPQKFQCEECIHIPTWDAMHDMLHIFKRR